MSDVETAEKGGVQGGIARLSGATGAAADHALMARRPANYQPLTPLDFLKRASEVYPNRTAVINGNSQISYAEFASRCRKFAAFLATNGITRGDTVAVMAANSPALLEAHYAVPMAGAVLNAINIRLDAATIGFMLNHGRAKAVVVDRIFAPVMAEALKVCDHPVLVIDYDDPDALSDEVKGERIGTYEYEALLADQEDPGTWNLPSDEYQAITLNYTSGTTGNPKGVAYSHRGAYFNAIANAITFELDRNARYLWTLPMFHCNGWTFTWGVTAVAGTHVCLRRVDPALIFEAIERHNVSHMCGAPVVLTMLIHAPDTVKRPLQRPVGIITGGAAPPSAVIEGMETMGFSVVHMYGLTETYGPSMICSWQSEWDALDLEARAGKMARQGVGHILIDDVRVVDEDTGVDVPRDGQSIGEIWIRGNTVMLGYLLNADATESALGTGWFRSGDLAVMHEDGYVEVKDRSKDIIISGGENISSLEVEEVLYRHPDIAEAAVVARPDEKWGETPCAFITLKPGVEEGDPDSIKGFCRDRMASFKIPRTFVFGALPKTSTGKIQKFELRERAKSL